jgi:hypothetical protein
VAGFVGIFALGLFYLWRQPQAASADGAVSPPVQTSAPKSTRRDTASAVRKATTASSDASAPESVPSAAAEIDQKVRGSLEELKDLLFRLELRREAGTISEEDYARERERVQKVLRELVRG